MTCPHRRIFLGTRHLGTKTWAPFSCTHSHVSLERHSWCFSAQRKGTSENNCPFALVGRVGCTTQRLCLTTVARQVAPRIPLAKMLKNRRTRNPQPRPNRHSGASLSEPQAPAQTPELPPRGFRRPGRFPPLFQNSPGGLLPWPSGQFLCHRVSRPNLRKPPEFRWLTAGARWIQKEPTGASRQGSS